MNDNNLIANVLLREIEELISNVERDEQTNQDWFINFLDKLNEYSFKY